MKLVKNPFTLVYSSVLLILVCSGCIVSYAQKDRATCSNIHSGTFYMYPKNSAEQYVDTRDEEYVHETNITTGDTSLWKIKWQNDCTYSLNLVEVSGEKADAVRAIMKKHTLVYKITSVTPNYYVFDGFLDKTTNPLIQTDTMWMTNKALLTNNELFKWVPDSLLQAAQQMSDTSKYVLLYVYRPGKLFLSLSDIPFYFDNVLMCMMHNNTGFLFKVLKEGNFELKSRQFKAESSLPIEVHFGKVYYVKAAVDWGVHQRLYNFKLDNQLMNEADGKADFEDLKFK